MSGRISIDNLSPELKEMIENSGMTEEQIVELLKSKGINELQTNSKNVIDAINELFQSANNGKELIANAIGEPLSTEDTFSAMSNDINSLLSQFKTNMMNNGITVESGDKFKQLIDKIATLADNEGKGIQYASGVAEKLSNGATYNKVNSGSNGFSRISITGLKFEPMILFAYNLNSISIFVNKSLGSCFGYYNTTDIHITIALYSDCSCAVLKHDGNNLIDFSNIILPTTTTNNTWNYYAIGVGEEDTTLRDSLASILQEEGASVTEEDDMASLISKVDEEFDRKNGLLLGTLNIISATELPVTGVENQVCVITDNPVEKFIVSQFTEDMTNVGDAICLDLATNERSDNRLVMADNGRVKLYYYINRVVQSGNAKETYVYKNNQWVLLVEGLVYLLLDGVDMNNTTFGDTYIYNCSYTKIDASTGEICLGTSVQSTYQYKYSCFSFANKINIDDYTKLTLRIKVSDTEWEPNIVVGLASKAISGTSSSSSGYNNWSNTGVSFTSYCNDEVYTEIGSSYPSNEYFTLEVDISKMTGTGYLCIGIEDPMSSYNWVRINTIGIQ